MVHKTSLTPTHLLKCLCQVRKVSGHVSVLGISIFPLSLRIFDCILELFRQCGILELFRQCGIFVVYFIILLHIRE